jgi:hypothetical protein
VLVHYEDDNIVLLQRVQDFRQSVGPLDDPQTRFMETAEDYPFQAQGKGFPNHVKPVLVLLELQHRSYRGQLPIPEMTGQDQDAVPLFRRPQDVLDSYHIDSARDAPFRTHHHGQVFGNRLCDMTVAALRQPTQLRLAEPTPEDLSQVLHHNAPAHRKQRVHRGPE